MLVPEKVEEIRQAIRNKHPTASAAQVNAWTQRKALKLFYRRRNTARKVSKRPKDAFYRSEIWKGLRYQALKKHGARCQCCGASAKTGAVLHVDHIKPRSKFPALALDLDNLQILCAPCNEGKSNLDQTDWR